MGIRKMGRVHYRVYGLSDKGMVRKNNEDAFVVNKDFGFFAVADGMGGHEKGEVASRLAVETGEGVVSSIFLSSENEDTFSGYEETSSGEEKMESVVAKTNRAIYAENLVSDRRKKRATADLHDSLSEKRKKMGTTFVCAKLIGRKMYIANSGDSRCYLVRKGAMQQLTRDHSRVEEALQAGKSAGNKPDPHRNKMRNYITSALGTGVHVDPDIVNSLLMRGDIYLLCSDGLTKTLCDEKVCHVICSSKSIKKAAHDLVAIANAVGGPDNITVLLVQIMGVEATSRPEKLQAKTVREPREDTLQ